MKTETTYRAEHDSADIGTIVVDENGGVTLKLSHPWQLEAEALLRRLKDEGVRDLGEVVLKEPQKLAPDQVFPELWRALALRGLVLKKTTQ